MADAGIQLFFNGPESLPSTIAIWAKLRKCELVCRGFNSIGIQSSGGAGKVLAEWMRDGKPHGPMGC